MTVTYVTATYIAIWGSFGVWIALDLAFARENLLDDLCTLGPFSTAISINIWLLS